MVKQKVLQFANQVSNNKPGSRGWFNETEDVYKRQYTNNAQTVCPYMMNSYIHQKLSLFAQKCNKIQQFTCYYTIITSIKALPRL